MTSSKPWIDRALNLLRQSLSPVPTEPNELDWKSGFSSNKERLVEHLCAFSNHSGGGFMVFGVDDCTGRVIGITGERVDSIVGQLTNLGRDGLEPPISIDHRVAGRLKMHDKQRNQISNLIADAVAAGRIKRKDPAAGNKFAEYLPYWV
jgi:hypothetical protein